MPDEIIELNSLEALEEAKAETKREVWEKLVSETYKFLLAQGVPRHRIGELATPAIDGAYSEWLTKFAEPSWAEVERDIRGGLPH